MLVLLKAKYIKRWKGKDGKWRYEYAKTKKERTKKAVNPIEKKVQFEENKIANLKYEKCFVFDSKGEIILIKSGGKDYIKFSFEEVEKMKGAKAFTHNHPSESSLSVEDIKAGYLGGINETRAVSKKYIFSAKIKPNFTDRDYNNFIDDIDKVDKWVIILFKEKIKQGEMSLEQANLDHWHKIWEIMDEDYEGFHYKRTLRKNK